MLLSLCPVSKDMYWNALCPFNLPYIISRKPLSSEYWQFSYQRAGGIYSCAWDFFWVSGFSNEKKVANWKDCSAVWVRQHVCMCVEPSFPAMREALFIGPISICLLCRPQRDSWLLMIAPLNFHRQNNAKSVWNTTTTTQISVKSVTHNTLFNLHNSSLYCHLSGEETEAERSYLLDSHGLSVSQCAMLFRAYRSWGRKWVALGFLWQAQSMSFLLHKSLHFPWASILTNTSTQTACGKKDVIFLGLVSLQIGIKRQKLKAFSYGKRTPINKY